jgi:hypothetical protein
MDFEMIVAKVWHSGAERRVRKKVPASRKFALELFHQLLAYAGMKMRGSGAGRDGALQTWSAFS